MNYLEVAHILLKNFKGRYPYQDILMGGDNAQDLSELLVKRIDPEIIDLYMETELGQGMILGMLMVFHLNTVMGIGIGEEEEEI